MTKFKNALLRHELKAGKISKGRLYQLTGLKLEPETVALNFRNKVSFVLYLISAISICPWLVLSRFWEAQTWANVAAIAAVMVFAIATIILDQANLEAWSDYVVEIRKSDKYYSRYEQY